jgi:hypothetical protein
MTTMLHEKVGTSDRRIPGWHRHAIDMALNRELSDDSFSRAALTRDFSKKVWQQFEHAATQESGKKISERFETQTYGAVKELLDRLREAGEPNVFKWITKFGEPENAREALDDLKGVGPKIASLVLREAAIFYGAWQGRIHQSNGWCFQPVDRWVLRWSKCIWPEAKWPDAKKISQAGRHRIAAEQIASKFTNHEQVKAMEFNMGAWFV